MLGEVMKHTFRRLVTAAAIGGGTAIVGSPIIVPAAATTVVPDDREQLARIELHTLVPAAPKPGEQVVVTGSITNVSTEPLGNVQALVRYDRRPIASRADIARLASNPELYRGWRPGHIYDMVQDVIAPGESASFELEFTIDATCAVTTPEALPCLDMPASGVYALGVDANVTVGDDRFTGGTARTVLPWMISPPGPLPVALIWPVIGSPEVGDGALSGQDVANIGEDGTRTADEAPGGGPTGEETPESGVTDEGGQDPDTVAMPVSELPDGLRQLLAAPGDTPVTWAVDPDTWSAEVAETIGPDAELVVLPPAVPDIGALARVDRSLAARVAAAGRLEQEQFHSDVLDAAEPRGAAPNRTTVAWSDTGAVSEAAVQAWADAGYSTVILPRDSVAMTTESAVASIDNGNARLTAILTDPGLDAAVADNAHPHDGTSARSAALDVRQRWLAETALAHAEPFRSGAAALVTAAPAGWSPPPEVIEAVLDVWTTTEWITPVTLDEVTGPSRPPLRGGAVPAAVLNPLRAGTKGLPGDYVRAVEQLHTDLARYHSLLAEPSGTSPTPVQTTAQAVSTLWEYDLETARESVRALRRSIAEVLASVSVVVNPSNTLSGNSGVFPVNIANNLDYAVTVRLEFDPANHDRLAIAPVEARVPGGQQQTVQVRAEAVANGEVPVSVQLATVDGVALGRAQQTIVNATHYGTIGWFVVGGSALLFAGGLSWRMVRGRRRAEP